MTTLSRLAHSNSSTCKLCIWWCGWLNEVDSERYSTLAHSQRIPGNQGGHCKAPSSPSKQTKTEGAVVRDKRYPYKGCVAAARTPLTAALSPALPNSAVVDDAQLVNRAKHPMHVSKLSACRTVERGWGNKPKGGMCQWLNVVRQVIQSAAIVGR